MTIEENDLCKNYYSGCGACALKISSLKDMCSHEYECDYAGADFKDCPDYEQEKE